MCYSVKVPTDNEMRDIPVEFRRDKKTWAAFRELQAWEARVDPETVKATIGLARKPRASQFQIGKAGERIYPKQFLPVIVADKGRLWLRPLRYALRPYWAEQEIASKYCTYNARLDTLLQRRTWKPLVGSKHALLPFAGFYENVADRDGQRMELEFTPQGKRIVLAPAIWDRWYSADGLIRFDSTALITDDPPPEVRSAGHDRCPIFLAEDAVEEWLHPERRSPAEWWEFLRGHREDVFYEHRLAA